MLLLRFYIFYLFRKILYIIQYTFFTAVSLTCYSRKSTLVFLITLTVSHDNTTVILDSFQLFLYVVCIVQYSNFVCFLGRNSCEVRV